MDFDKDKTRPRPHCFEQKEEKEEGEKSIYVNLLRAGMARQTGGR